MPGTGNQSFPLVPVFMLVLSFLIQQNALKCWIFLFLVSFLLYFDFKFLSDVGSFLEHQDLCLLFTTVYCCTVCGKWVLT